MSEPSKEVIDRIKAQFPDRALNLVELHDGDESYHFVMTGPNKDEYKKYVSEMVAAREVKNDAEKNEKLTEAVERAALAMIRWPARDEVKALFESKPAMSSSFANHLHNMAGQNFEVRSKKL